MPPTPAAVVVAPRTLVALVAVSLGGVLLLALAYAARGILVQFVVAIVLAMALDPFVQMLERRGLRRGSAVGVAFTVALLGVALFVYLLVPPLVDELTRFAHNVPGLLEKLTRGHGRFGFLEGRFQVVEHARAAVAGQGSEHVLGSALNIAGRVFSTVGAIATVAFLTLFVSLGGRAWFDGFLQVVPEGSRARWRRGGSGVSDAVGGYVGGNLLISVIAGTVTTLILLATHVPYPVPLGIVVAFFDLIPLVGATIGMVIVAAVALTKGIPTTAIVVGAMVLYQQVENHVLQQLVYNRTVKLSPLAIALSVAAGAEIGGIVGALLGIPFAGALKVVSRELLDWRRGKASSVRTGVDAAQAAR
jgi:predicted PurR-regulated permease PerM